jgi:hypothetical protein
MGDVKKATNNWAANPIQLATAFTTMRRFMRVRARSKVSTSV